MEKASSNFKLFRLLATLSSNEFNALRRMAESDFFKTKPKTADLFKLLKPYHPDFDAPKLTKDYLTKKLFKTQPFKDNDLTNLFHDATALAEDFLLSEEMKSNERERKRQLREIYRKRLLYKDFHLSVGKLVTSIENQSACDETDFFELWEAFHRCYFLPQNTEMTHRSADFITAFEALDKFYVLHKLHYLNELVIRKKLTTIDRPFLFQTELSALNTSLPPFDNAPIFSIFQRIATLYHQPHHVENYQKIKQTLIANVEELNQTQLQNILIHLLNFTFFKINKKEAEYFKEANELYQFGDKYQLLETENVIAHSTFINVVDTAVNAEDLKWAGEFIEKYQAQLFPELAENTLHFATAIYHFGRKNFQKTLFHLEQFRPVNIMYQLRMNLLFIKTYYELLDENEDADEKFTLNLLSFEQFLKRKDVILPYHKQTFLNGIQAVRRLYKLRNNPNLSTNEKQRLMTEVLKKDGVAGYYWLKQKMEML